MADKPKLPSGVDTTRHVKAAQTKLLKDKARGVFKTLDTPEKHAAKRASGYFKPAARAARAKTIDTPEKHAAKRASGYFDDAAKAAKSAVRSNSGRIAAKVGAKLAGRVLVPLAVAADVVATVGAGTEGIRAIKAQVEAKRNEKYMKKNYGDVSAATETRRFRHRKQNERSK
jgi:hypothetical protein